MGAELELTVTITYKGVKSRIGTVAEAIPIILNDLNALEIPHPKRSNVSVVYDGTVRFFWVALPNSAIHNTLIHRIRPRDPNRIAEHNALLERLSIAEITLRESVADERTVTSQHALPSRASYAPKITPDASLYARPMGVESPTRSRFDSSSRRYSGDIEHVEHYSVARHPSFNASRADARLYQVNPAHYASAQQEQRSVEVKAEAVELHIPPRPPPTSEGEEDIMQMDTEDLNSARPPPPGSAGRRSLKRNRYASIPDPSPRTTQDAHIQQYRRELWEVRRRLNDDVAQEMTLLRSLTDLGAEEVLVETPHTVGDNFATKARIQHLEAELQMERKMGKELEDQLADIRRECPEPFVVPALLDAFITISKLTSQALEED
ncbi:hypothetical protein C8J57DRAFT_1327050 [Mycena rebaudengoi]|nr:hypothetical protein C8J57DRAFT_1327050 [Mycena rebaudengoi]